MTTNQLYMNIGCLVDIPKIKVLKIEFKPPIIHIYASLSGKRANIEVFSNYILSKIKIDGYTNMEIINDIRKMGYTDGNTQPHQYLAFFKETNGVTTLNYIEQRKQSPPRQTTDT